MFLVLNTFQFHSKTVLRATVGKKWNFTLYKSSNIKNYLILRKIIFNEVYVNSQLFLKHTQFNKYFTTLWKNMLNLMFYILVVLLMSKNI